MKKKVSKKNNPSDRKKLILLFVGIAIFFAVVAVVVFVATRPTNKSYENCAIGDVDGSGQIDSGDCVLIQQHLSGSKELFDSQINNGDVNLDGKLDETDIEIIQKYATGQIKKLPYTGNVVQQETIKKNSATQKTDETESTVYVENSWKNDDGTHSYQLKITVKNLDDSKLRNWQTQISLSDAPEISGSWDCECEISDGKIVIEGESIPAESSMSCGVIVKTEDEMQILTIETNN